MQENGCDNYTIQSLNDFDILKYISIDSQRGSDYSELAWGEAGLFT